MDTEQKDNLLAELGKKVEEARGKIENPKLRLFAEEYAIDRNGYRAYVAAGYAAASARTEASLALTKPNIMPYIDAINTLVSYKKGVKKEDNIAILKAIRDSNIKDFVKLDDNGMLKFKPMSEWTKEMSMAVEGIKMGKYGIELKLQGKSWAIDMLNKNLGFYEKDNKQKGEGIAQAVGILLPDNTRGKIVVDKDSEV